ncbi:MAG TPA: lysophospholipid acyltransferase family protein [Candidatus Sulfotelmatobacter sp.]|nr:lysophospholipid acyltransferase family protein [Candidatus Sulfotelmatobacter sp.]
MIVVRFIHTLFLYLLALVAAVIGTLIALIIALFARNKPHVYHLAARYWSRILVFFSGMKIEVKGRENIPPGQPLVLAVNHQSMADVPILLSTVPLYFHFAIKKELFGIPFFGWYLRQAGYFPIDRELVLGGFKIVKTMNKLMEGGDSILIFPEGTRSRDGKLGTFRRGSLLAALKSGVPVLPIALSGSINVTPRGTKLINRAKVRLTFGRPVNFKDDDDYDKKVTEVRDFIARNV